MACFPSKHGVVLGGAGRLPGWLLLFAAALVPSCASAHLYPISPVKAELRACQGEIQATFESNVVYWKSEVLGGLPPPSDWSEEQLADAERYIDARFRLELDGRPLDGRLADARYSEEPWSDWLDGTVRFKMVYPLPRESGTLSGSSRFFREFYEEVSKEGAEHQEHIRHAGVRQVFETRLKVAGKVPKRLTLTMKEPDFSFPLADAYQSTGQGLAQSFTSGFLALLGAPALFLLAAVCVLGWGGRPVLAGAAACCAAAAALYALAPELLEPWLGISECAAVLLAGLMVRLRARPAWLAALLVLSSPLWASEARGASRLLAGGQPFGSGAALLLGLAAAAACAAGAVFVLLRIHRRDLEAMTLSVSGRLFESSRRSAATLLVILSVLMLGRILIYGGPV